MTHNGTNIERSVWPFIANKVQVCHTIRNHIFTLSGTALKITPSRRLDLYHELQHKTLIYFHPHGQFLGPVFKQNVFVLKLSDFDFANAFYELKLENIYTPSSDENVCNSNDSSYDSRVREKARNLTMKHSRCLPTFLAEDDDDILCLNNTDGQEAFNNYLLAFDNARLNSPPPCRTNKINLRFKNQQNIIENLNMFFTVLLEKGILTVFSFPSPL